MHVTSPSLSKSNSQSRQTRHGFNAEKNLRALKTIMTLLPSTTRLAFVGDGPERDALQQHFADMPHVKFMVSIVSSIRQH